MKERKKERDGEREGGRKGREGERGRWEGERVEGREERTASGSTQVLTTRDSEFSPWCGPAVRAEQSSVLSWSPHCDGVPGSVHSAIPKGTSLSEGDELGTLSAQLLWGERSTGPQQPPWGDFLSCFRVFPAALTQLPSESGRAGVARRCPHTPGWGCPETPQLVPASLIVPTFSSASPTPQFAQPFMDPCFP